MRDEEDERMRRWRHEEGANAVMFLFIKHGLSVISQDFCASCHSWLQNFLETKERKSTLHVMIEKRWLSVSAASQTPSVFTKTAMCIEYGSSQSTSGAML